MIKVLDETMLAAVLQRATKLREITVADKSVVVYLYAGLSLVFDLSAVVWKYANDQGVLLTTMGSKYAVEELYKDTTKYLMRASKLLRDDMAETELHCDYGEVSDEGEGLGGNYDSKSFGDYLNDTLEGKNAE